MFMQTPVWVVDSCRARDDRAGTESATTPSHGKTPNRDQRRPRSHGDHITRAQQAIAVPKGNTAALAYMTSFVDDVKKNGFVAAAIQQTRLPGASVAP